MGVDVPETKAGQVQVSEIPGKLSEEGSLSSRGSQKQGSARPSDPYHHLISRQISGSDDGPELLNVMDNEGNIQMKTAFSTKKADSSELEKGWR